MKRIFFRLSGLILAAILAAAGGAAQEDAQYEQRLLAVAVSELGYSATKGGYTKFGEWGGNAYGEWCSEFVSWCVSEADALYGTQMLDNVYPMQTSCEQGAEWFEARGQYVTVSGELKSEGKQFYLSDGTAVAERPYVPKPGDLIFIEWYKYNRLDHVGIVEFVTADADGTIIVHTIEGNNHILGPRPSVVARYSYRLDDPSIRGYGVTGEAVVGTELGSGSSGASVTAMQQTLKELGYYDGDCAGKFGKATENALKEYQRAKGLEATGYADVQTQTALMRERSSREAVAQARLQAEAEEAVRKNVQAAKAALASSWYGEFDPYDEEAAWARLMQPLTVLDVKQNERVYLSDGVDGSRKTYDEHRGFFYGTTVGVKVLETRDGWTKIEAYNDYDELEQGWVRAGRIRTVTPNDKYGIIVDKMTQRLYLYKEGKLLTTLLCSTGTTSGQNEGYNETASGDFFLASWVGDFWSGNLLCKYAMRFNGGDLLHMVPSIPNADGTDDFSICESALGRRASHGCVRVQRKSNEDGYDHKWLWDNLRGEKNVKFIVWDDDGRSMPRTADDAPVYYNPDGGSKYHTTARCQSVKSRYLPLTKMTYGELSKYPYTELTPCNVCAAPERPETVRAWNAAVEQAKAELEGE